MNRNPFAGVGRRALATIIDWIPLSAIYIANVALFGSFEQSAARTNGNTSNFFISSLGPTGILMLTLCAAFYYIGMEMTFSGTIGKLMTGLRVRNADGSPLSIRGALCRFLFRPIDSILFNLVGAVFVWNTSKNQRLGDLLGDSVVVFREFVPQPATIVYSDATGWQSY